MADGSVLFMNARTGTTSTRPFIDSSSNSESSDHSLRVPADFNAGITIMQARDFAIAEHPDAFIEKIELSMEEGIAVYSVRFLDDARIDVNANNGTIERTEPADNDRDDFRVRESAETESHGDSKIDDKSDDSRDDSFEDNPSRRGSDDS